MLTRLKVSGFKNLVDVDVRFGPFTCIAGANGTGKSNLFDAIQFLSRLASDTFVNAAASIRGDDKKMSSVQSLFHRVGNEYDGSMLFSAEMIIPPEGVDDLGQLATASSTFVKYTLELAFRSDDDLIAFSPFELLREELEQINISDAAKHLRFPHSAKEWRRSVVKGRKTSSFISTFIPTDEKEGNRIVKLSQEGGGGGRPKSFLAENLPRTVLSTVNAAESPTALLARREMQSWRLLQLEPAALRSPDDIRTPPGIDSDGSHLPATLYYLARASDRSFNGSVNGSLGEDSWIYEQVAFRLSELIDDVYEVRIDRDEKRQLLTLQVKDRNGTIYPARELSDGTLRFLALAVLESDRTSHDVICLEEPENGIHPSRIPAILQLLQDIAVDVDMPVAEDNPLRQIIINTHSPTVVNLVPPDSLLIASTVQAIRNRQRYKRTIFEWLQNSWRADTSPEDLPVMKGRLLAYLNPVPHNGLQTSLQIENVDG
ncbi:MAG: ATPase [Chloroflexi bacterium]|nr:MAG: ATPase [Chloroflexota bacterium]